VQEHGTYSTPYRSSASSTHLGQRGPSSGGHSRKCDFSSTSSPHSVRLFHRPKYACAGPAGCHRVTLDRSLARRCDRGTSTCCDQPVSSSSTEFHRRNLVNALTARIRRASGLPERSPIRRARSPVMQTARSAGQLLGRDRASPTVWAAHQIEQQLATAVQAPHWLAIIVIRALSDLTLHRTPADKPPNPRRVANPRDDTHDSLSNEIVARYAGPRPGSGTSPARRLAATLSA